MALIAFIANPTQIWPLIRMDLCLIVTLMFVGAGLSAFVGFAIPHASSESIAIAASLGAVLGALAGYLLLAVAKSIFGRSPSRRQADRSSSAPTPPPFRERMAQFAEKDVRDVMAENDPYESKMPFWSTVDAILRIPPKSAAMIRETLLSIRRTLR